jgi:predicted GIY-YIG superfamily endonuclease
MRDGQFYKFWVYIVENRTRSLYTGMTGFFDRRIGQHKLKLLEGFTKKYGPTFWSRLKRMRSRPVACVPRPQNFAVFVAAIEHLAR